MTIYEEVGKLWKQALKDRSPTKDTLALIRNEIKNKLISTRVVTDGLASEDSPTDQLAISVLNKMAKMRKESIFEYETAGRLDLVDKERAELAVIENFLPTQLTADELELAVRAVIAELGATSIKDTGQVMKTVMGRTQGRADGKAIQAVVKELLT